MTDRIIAMEWEMFQQVNNVGGRASCQDRPDTFDIMRSSQLRCWPEKLLESYEADLIAAKAEGDNLLTYKYGYMMAQTDPEGYEKIRDKLPPVSSEKAALVEKIVAQQMAQHHQLASRYPKYMRRTRPSDSHADDIYGWTSAETYLRGELKTYSMRTLELYDDFMQTPEGGHLVEDIMTATVRSYGYRDLEDAEKRLS